MLGRNSTNHAIDVTVAKDGQEAFDLVKESMKQEKLYNLIFMDVSDSLINITTIANKDIVDYDARNGWPHFHSTHS